MKRLTPGSIAKHLYTVDPDRDERAPQLCAEALLTLVENGYDPPEDSEKLKSPKRQQWATRSLTMRVNFLAGQRQGWAGDDDTTPEDYGGALAAAQSIRGSSHLDLAQAAFEGLIDPDTQRGQPGAWLLRPFHESLLWYDARKPSPSRPDWTVRKVYMRGSGITFARLLSRPPDPEAAVLGQRAVAGIRRALTGASPLGTISERLEAALTSGRDSRPEPDEKQAWDTGGDAALRGLARSLCRHAEGVMEQGGTSEPARLWQLRTILALDFAMHVLRRAWEATETPAEDRFLLLSFGSIPRAEDVVRKRSEDSYGRARIRLSEATLRTLASRMKDLVGERVVDWEKEFEKRGGLGARESVGGELTQLGRKAKESDYLRLARIAVENGSYGRAEDGFRVLLDSVGLLAGSRYRYLTASPDLLSALVGALSADMPMPSNEFFAAVKREWGLVLDQQGATGTSLAGRIDGAALERNARHAEKLLNEAGLALSLSDRTTVVGERAARKLR